MGKIFWENFFKKKRPKMLLETRTEFLDKNVLWVLLTSMRIHPNLEVSQHCLFQGPGARDGAQALQVWGGRLGGGLHHGGNVPPLQARVPRERPHPPAGCHPRTRWCASFRCHNMAHGIFAFGAIRMSQAAWLQVESEQPPGNPKLGIDQTTGAQKHKHGIIQQ